MDSRDHVEGLRNLLLRLQNMQVNPSDSWGVSSAARAPTSTTSRPWDHDNWEYDDDDEHDEFISSDVEYDSEYEDFDDGDGYEGETAYIGHSDGPEVYLESDYDDYY